VIVAGAGIAGLSCGYELMKRGHDVVVLEASGRAGGHVRTIRDPFADGLYADIGAEHFYYPGYNTYWRYLQEFELTAIPYPRRDHMIRFIGGKPYTEEDLHSRAFLGSLEFNQREIDFLSERPWWALPLLFLQPYIDKISNEYDPFVSGLHDLDRITVTDLLQKLGASPTAVTFAGGSGSALQAVWAAAIKKLRGTPLIDTKLFRIQGGNQRMTDSFAARLGERLHLGCPVTGIEHSKNGVTVSYRESGQEKKMDADYLVSCMSLVMLRQIPVTPAWPEAKEFVIRNMPYYTRSRVVFQSRTRFWKRDQVSPNWEPPDPTLMELWSMAEEVNTPRGILIGGAEPGTTAEAARATFHKLYPGKSADIEHTLIHSWANDPWAAACERFSQAPGQLAKFWPKVTEPSGRIHFAGAYAAHMTWGQEAAVESANRAADEISRA
jgi:monoamine oxidase